MNETDRVGGPNASVKVDLQALRVVAYTAEFKVVGTAHFGVGQRTSSRRASDYIRAFSDSKMTLADVRIYSRERNEIIDTAPFVVLNLDKVDLIYAQDIEDEAPVDGEARPQV